MAGFGLLYTSYLVIVLLEVWFVWREDIIAAARRSRGLKRRLYAALALWTYDTSPEALEVDHKVITVLAGIGLPMACMLHGYVGFIFGAIKANPWWSSPLMPVIFLLSAAVSGIALLSIVYQAVSKLRRVPAEAGTVSGMARWLWFFLILTITLELPEIIMLAYEKSEPWHIISKLLTERLEFSFITVQMVIGGLIPIILLGIVVMMNRYLHERIRNTLVVASSLLLLLQVFSMRWNVVIGGQLLSKSLRGLRSTYNPEVFGREGVLMAIALFVTPFVLLLAFDRILPIHRTQEAERLAAGGDGHGGGAVASPPAAHG
jgi:Ni/Fe-hydrogenase subunit HybB-like protein